MKAVVVLTSSESKRLIGKAVAGLDIVEHALRSGRILIARSTTTAYVAEEILGIDIDIGGFAAGIVMPKGLCANQAATYRYLLIEKGKLLEDVPYSRAIHQLEGDDVFVKSANALDIHGVAGILAASGEGGRIGMALGTILARRVNLVVPVGLEKLIPVPVSETVDCLGIGSLDYCMGLPVGMIPVYGRTISEIEALDILSNAEAIPVAAGGVNGAEGSVVLAIRGEDSDVKKAISIIEKIKGEPSVKVPPTDCSKCLWSNCPKYSGTGSRKRYLSFERGKNGKWKAKA